MKRQQLPVISEQQLVGMSENYRQNVRGLQDVLNDPIIDLRKLRVFLANGIPDEVSTLKQIAWKVALGYLPRTKSKWSEQEAKQQSHYIDFIAHYLPQNRYQNYPILMNKQHPEWSSYEEDYYLWQQIQKDTQRTQSQLAFFSTQVQPILIPFLTATRKQKWKLINGEEEQQIKLWQNNKKEHRRTYRYDYMTRILFIFAKVNPRAQYVQGMNQILAPIFYLLNNRKKGPIQQAASFFMFNNVMSDLLELNIEDFDKRENGIHARMKEVDHILLATQPALWQKLTALKIDQLYYCFRWLTLLFAQQFQLFQILRIWQTIFACEDRALYVNCFCVALLSQIKKQIQDGNYTTVLTAIKNIRDHASISAAIFRAFELYQQLKGSDINSLAQYNLNKLQSRELKKSKSLKPRLFQKLVRRFI